MTPFLRRTGGHTVPQARGSRPCDGGFKVQYLDGQLVRRHRKSDAGFQKLFKDPSVCPDELKLYPCSLIPHTELMAHYEAGRWRPYDREELLRLLVSVMPLARNIVACRESSEIFCRMHTESHGTNFRETAGGHSVRGALHYGRFGLVK